MFWNWWSLVLFYSVLTVPQSTHGLRRKPKNDLSNEDKKLIVDLHNKARAEVVPSASNMKYVHWDEQLASIARSYAKRCVGRHNSARVRQQGKFRTIGENIYYTWDWHMNLMSANANQGCIHIRKFRRMLNLSAESKIIALRTKDPLNVSTAFHYWMREKKNFSYIGQGRCYSKCGHYLQIVRDTTYAMGCGTAFCKSLRGRRYINVHNFICNYGDGYNNEALPYEAGKKCSRCPSNFPSCRQGLCDKL